MFGCKSLCDRSREHTRTTKHRRARSRCTLSNRHTHVRHTGIACAPGADPLVRRSLSGGGPPPGLGPGQRGRAMGGAAWWRLLRAFWGRIRALGARNQPGAWPVEGKYCVRTVHVMMMMMMGIRQQHTVDRVRHHSALNSHTTTCAWQHLCGSGNCSLNGCIPHGSSATHGFVSATLPARMRKTTSNNMQNPTRNNMQKPARRRCSARRLHSARQAGR